MKAKTKNKIPDFIRNELDAAFNPCPHHDSPDILSSIELKQILKDLFRGLRKERIPYYPLGVVVRIIFSCFGALLVLWIIGLII